MKDPHRKGFREGMLRFAYSSLQSLFCRLPPSSHSIHCLVVLRVVPACLAVLAGTVGPAVEARAQDLASDRQALIALYNATDGENWANNENWLSDEPLDTWFGVIVSEGRVRQLHLFGNRLTGAIPGEIGSLDALVNLTLGGNQLTGVIPAEMGSLAALKTLNLAFNHLTGPCLLYTSPSPRDGLLSRMPSSA